MGVTHSLHLIEPDTFARVVGELKPHPFTCALDVERFLEAHQFDSDADCDALVGDFASALAEHDSVSADVLYSELILNVVTNKVWDLDKSLSDRGLYKPLSTFPALKPLRFLIAFTGWDIDVPTELWCDSGLYGLWSARFLRSRIETLKRFSTQQDARHYAAFVKWGVVDRMLRRPARATAALDAWLEFWDCWEDIRCAINETVDRGWALGYAMCP